MVCVGKDNEKLKCFYVNVIIWTSIDESPEFRWRYSSGAWPAPGRCGAVGTEPATDFE